MADSAGTILYRWGVAPTTNDQHEETGRFTSDQSGKLTIVMTDVFTSSNEYTGICSNA